MMLGTPSYENNEETDLWDRIQKLKESVCRENLSSLTKEIEDIDQKAITVRNKIDQDRGDNQREIKKLEERVSTLEKEIGILKDQVQRLQKNVDSIDAGSAMKIIENHVVTFVLPRNKKIADIDAINQMLEYVEKNKIYGTWNILQNQCNIKLWTREHSKTIKKFVNSRNDYAHHKKFDLASLREVLINLMPHREEHMYFHNYFPCSFRYVYKLYLYFSL
jgi:predicted nuclease with TOPRIM domain